MRVAVLAVLTFLTVVYLYLRAKYRASPLGEFYAESRRERVIRGGEVLQRHGYRVIDERVGHEVQSYVGARRFTTYLIVDFLVEKDGVVHPAKVRSARDPQRISGAWVRRQLWPLYALYGAPVAYVDADAGTIDLVDFELDYPGRHYMRRWRGRFVWLVVGVVTGWLLARAG